MSIRIYLLPEVCGSSIYIFILLFQFIKRGYKKESDFLHSHIVMG